MEDSAHVLERAMGATGRVVRGVRSDQYAASTPCKDWDVRGLMNHLVAGNRYFAAFARGEQPGMSIFAEEHIGVGDPVTAYEESANAALQAWRLPGAADMPSSYGAGPKPIEMHLVDTVVHGWDLATATNQDRTFDAAVTQGLYDDFYGKVPSEVRSAGGVFDFEVECAPDAPASDRLAAYLGRTP